MEIEPADISTKGYEFYWDVSGYGYQIVDKARYRCETPDPPGPIAEYYPDRIFFFSESLRIETFPPWLIDKRNQQFTPRKVYRPLSDPVLHRKFARLKTENLESEVLGFASKYGMLGRTIRLSHHGHSGLYLADPDGYADHWRDIINAAVIPVADGFPAEGESLRVWQREIDKMGVLLAIWDLIRREEVGKLGQIVMWHGSDAVVVRFKWTHHNGHYEISPADDEKSNGYHAVDLLANFERYRRGDILGPALHYVCDMLNHHLDGITPRLSANSGYKVEFAPQSLLDALWLMFMLEVDGTTKTCWHCDKSFDPTRKDNIYCSGACKRMAHYYKKTGTEVTA